MPEGLKPRALHELFAEIGGARAELMRTELAELSTGDRRRRLRQEWALRLGDVEPKAEPTVKSSAVQNLNGITVERVALEVEPGIIVPMLLLFPSSTAEAKSAIVVGLAQAGKEKFLTERAGEISALLKNGVAVCLPDVRGTGETAPAGSRGRQSEATAISATELMLGGTLLGARLRDVRAVLKYLRTRRRGEGRFGLWGESFSPTNPLSFADPLIDGDESPHQSEPLGGLLALFGGLYEDDICAAAARGMIAGYQSVLRNRFCYLPHDVVVPGALTAGDLCDVAAALAPRSLRLEALVDGRNCPMSASEVERLFEPTRQAYHAAADKLSLLPALQADLAMWFANALN
jgi:hypothetical protein